MSRCHVLTCAADTVKVEGGAITWTIPEEVLEEVGVDKNKIIIYPDAIFGDGLKFALFLRRLEGDHGKLSLVNSIIEAVDIDCTVVVRDTKEVVKEKLDGLPSTSAGTSILVPSLFSSIKGGVTVEVEVRSCEVARSEAVARLRARLGQRREDKEAKPKEAESEQAMKGEADWNMEQVLKDMGEMNIIKKKKSKSSEQVQKKKQEKRDIKMGDQTIMMEAQVKEIKKVLAEISQAKEDVEELLEDQRRGRERAEELRWCLAEEVRNRQVMERSLGEQVAEEERRERYFVEELRKMEVKMRSQREEEDRERHPVEERRHGVGQEEARQLGAIPKTRRPVAAPRPVGRAALQAGRPGAGRSYQPADASRARRSVERMVGMLEERGRLAYIPTSSCRRLVAQLRSRLGGLSDISLSHMEEEVARMAGEEEASKTERSVEKMLRLLEERGRLASLPTPSLRRLVTQLRARLGGLSELSLAYVEGEVGRMVAREKVV